MITDTIPVRGARARRLPRRIAMFFATSLTARTAGVVCQVVQVPIIIRSVGAESFGLWMALAGAMNLLLFADFGLGLGAQHVLAGHFHRHDHAAARDVLGRVFLYLTGLAVLLGVGLTLALRHVDFAAVFELEGARTTAQAPTAALALLWIFCAGIPFNLAQRVAFASQKGSQYNLAQAAGSVLSLAAVAAGAGCDAGLTGLVALAQGAVVLVNVVLLALQITRFGWWGGWRLRPQVAPVHQLVRLGIGFNLQQVLASVVLSLPQLMIGVRLGAVAVTPYNLAQRLFSCFAVTQNTLMLPLWPAYSEAKTRREFSWMRRALRHSLRATALCTVLPMLVLAGFVPGLIRFWVGPQIDPPTELLVALLWIWNSLIFIQQPFSFLLAGVSEERRTTFYSALSAASCVGLMYELAPLLGASGVVLGLLLGYLPFTFLGHVIEVRRYLHAARAAGDTAAVAPQS